ncbi:MAG: hypothetical protein LBR79_06800 [Oscillospiraceae bacterium]|nr:hypothetical protein [Oscillospiraceae bacterium]
MVQLAITSSIVSYKIGDVNIYFLIYSCYDLKQFSKVNLSVYFLPTVGWEKVIKIKRFSNETAIV